MDHTNPLTSKTSKGKQQVHQTSNLTPNISQSYRDGRSISPRTLNTEQNRNKPGTTQHNKSTLLSGKITHHQTTQKN
ncbi:hypothetical protein OXYTRIMIC_663 [Oxytricha trifallax]|uniref:Uncharacterized protein n=1 Tax=Oxytricha trifallax TaxID=1172189 RepID=A0A073I0L4_9SPIT|nr:hypothetical protein OXYTRIMIC_663 [Oxytricha trifallax]